MATKAEQLKSAQTMLAAAEKALETEAGSGALSISVNDETQTFESREDALAFVNQLEKRIAFLRKRPPLFRPVRIELTG